jgi:hypothetical protein
MDLSYELEAEDFLEYQMFQSATTSSLKKRRMMSKVFLSLLYIAVGAYFKFAKDQTSTAVIFLGAGVMWYFLYPAYAKWRYKNHFKQYIKANYHERFGKTSTLSIQSDGIDFNDSTGNGHIKSETLAHLIELKAYYLVTIETGQSLIVPKSAVSNAPEFKKALKDFGVQYHDEQAWVWS